MDRKSIKTLAKKQIKGNVGIMFLCALLSCIIGNIIPGLATIIIMPVLEYGIVLNYVAMKNGKEATVERLFDGFKNFGQAWCLYFLKGLYILLWSMLFIIPGIVKTFAYSFAPYILAENPEMSSSEAITASKKMTKGHKGELFVLYLSFIGWMILGSITFGIAYIWIIPYFNETLVNAYESIKNQSSVSAAE